MKAIECDKCGYLEFVSDSFATNTKLTKVKCTTKKGCNGNMKIVE